MNPPLYKIANWAQHFEHRDARQNSGPLKWIAIPTKTDGLGFGRLAQQKHAAELLAAWYLLLGIAAKQPREARGELSRDGRPLTPEDLELMTRFPAAIFTRAFEFFTHPAQAWLTVETCANMQDAAQNRATGHNSTVQYSTVQGGTIPPAPGGAPALVDSQKLTDADWLESLKANPAFAGIEIEREAHKCRTWCDTNRKQFSRRRFLNWLNRIERPLNAATPGRFGKLF